MRNIPPAYGERVDIGGRALCARVSRVAAGPTVVFESGGGSPSLVWLPVERELSGSVTTVAYDRAGIGLSDRGPLPRTGDAVAADLSSLLAALDLARPFVVVAHSAGGLFARMFHASRPDDLAGLVFVDAVDGLTYDDVKAHLRPYERAAQGVLAGAARVADWFGLVSLIARRQAAPANVAADPELLAARRLVWRGRNRLAGSRAESAQLPNTARAVRRLPGLGDLPVVVIRAGEQRGSFRRVAQSWAATQARIGALSTRSTTVTADGSGHFVQQDRPDVVAAAIRLVIESL